jgi:hypothetical protein
VLTIGGSVTCGVGAAGREWPVALVDVLATVLPDCTGGTEHVVHNGCQRSASSDHWVDLLSVLDEGDRGRSVWGGRKRSQFFVSDYDLVILETTVNDVGDLERLDKDASNTGLTPALRSQKYTELLIRLLLEAGTCVMYFSVASRANDWKSPGPRRPDVTLAQVEVARHYNVPYISMLDAYGPLKTNEARKSWHKLYYALGFHPNQLHHTVAAHLVASALLRHRAPLLQPQIFPGFEGFQQFEANYPPLVVSARDLQLYTQSHPLHVSTSLPRQTLKDISFLTTATGFTKYEDVPHKSGLIATTIGAVAIFSLPASAVAAHIVLGVINLSILKSYEQAGCVKVATSTSTRPKIIDCLWNVHVSEPVVEELRFRAPPANSSFEVTLTVVNCPTSAQARRNGTKVKILGLTLY